MVGGFWRFEVRPLVNEDRLESMDLGFAVVDVEKIDRILVQG